jgi:hypothetical protein
MSRATAHQPEREDAYTHGGGVPVVFVDENPGIVLADSEGPTAALSYWRSVLSPAGAGSVLALWRRDHQTELWTDNRALADLIGHTFLRHWPVLTEHLQTLPRPRAARFTTDCDRGYRLRADTVEGAGTLAAEWSAWKRAVRRPEHQHAGVALDDRPLTVSSVIALCDAASITLNGQRLPGEVDRKVGPTFVALAESWSPVS